MAAQTSTKLTYEDYLEIPNDGKRYEIIDGELYVNAAPNTKHNFAAGNIYGSLWTYMLKYHTGQVFDAPYDVIFSMTDVVQPDVVWVTTERMRIVTVRAAEGAPDLVVEVLSPSSIKLDEKIKRTRYEFFGVPEYWIVDPEKETVRIFRQRGKVLVLVAELAGNDTITSPLLPKFVLRVHDIFHVHEA